MGNSTLLKMRPLATYSEFYLVPLVIVSAKQIWPVESCQPSSIQTIILSAGLRRGIDGESLLGRPLWALQFAPVHTRTRLWHPAQNIVVIVILIRVNQMSLKGWTP
ncbi:hypothetical protein G9A89_000299 [Geosiphon pyriformis]|nr:hypothetical protein G9A89_000299 [Geosiphon pyriformis]